ncbi:hypothetical protein [Maritimibacter sp. DP1N21-5]|uniref:hypothetical protein n=1 Tax=Maritimibacter sp. DP1N21-5 TaxID=2836867 RepID=UPI001C491E65|nr:hypothetical protein [Maritimibacter sp. DP1N21-5]MBV7409137.1 hypothetical protein [Maritimibacter sp. DP1N21-5]
MKPLFALGSLVLLLAACSEQDMCIYNASSDLKAAERQLGTLRGNVARGYAIHKTQERVTYIGVCYDKQGDPYGCPKTEWERVERPVAIDVGDQRRQIAALESRLPALRAATARASQQCRVAYPEG